MRSGLLFLAGLVLLPLAAPRAVADEVLEDDWAVVRLAGTDVGHARTRAVRKGDAVETTVSMKLTIRRMGAVITIESEETSLEDAASGRLRRMRSKMTMSATDTVTDIRFENGEAHVTTTVLGRSRTSKMSCPADAVGPWRIDRLTRETGFAAGAELEVVTFVKDMGGGRKLRIRVGEPEETTLLDGATRRLTRVDTEFEGVGLKLSSWYDTEGRLQKTVLPLAGLSMETYAASKERALQAERGGELAPDLFRKTLIAAKHRVPHPRRLDAALLRIRAKDGMPDFADERQQVAGKEDDGALLLRIERRVPPPGRAATAPPAELAASLAPNSMIQSDAKEVAQAAAEAAGAETDPWKKAQRLERWVHRNLTEKNMDIGFASALEVCRNREGDCTEHAVFLAALCRAQRIPCNVVMGVVYFGGVWGGHAWNEVWIDGGWYPLDATQGYGSVDPLHLSFSKMTLADSGFGEEFLGLLQGLGNLDIEVAEVRWHGRTIRPGEAAWTVSGDRYVNPLWGIALTRPEGWEFDPPEHTGQARISNRLLEIEGRSSAGKSSEIRIDAVDAPPGVTLDTLKAAYAGRFDRLEGIEVDGRPALRGTRTRGAQRGVDVFVLAGGVRWRFALDRIDGDADAERFAAFLGSIDFDAR